MKLFPLLLVFLFSIELLIGQNLNPGMAPRVSWGQVQRIPEFESNFIGKRTIDILVPDDYSGHPELRYPVLYMHDGQMLFDTTFTWNHQEWGVDEALGEISRQSSKSCIVVAIHNAGASRYEEFFPEKPFMMLDEAGKKLILDLANQDSKRAMKDNKPSSDNYLKFIVNELKPFIDINYRTFGNSANTYIAGSSMGGLISMYAICEYPNVFGSAACLSTHWPGIFKTKENPIPDTFLRYLENRCPKAGQNRLYFDCGTVGLDSLYPKYQAEANLILRRKGYGKKDFLSIVDQGASHSEMAWKARMPGVLRFLLMPDKR
jgi:predicted alpha/beta superfamily hydrolase